LISWFDASKPGTITLNGGDVSNWEAVNDATIDAAQGTGSKQPLYAIAAQNGLNAIDFDPDNLTGKEWTTRFTDPIDERVGDRVMIVINSKIALDIEDISKTETNKTELDKFGPLSSKI